MSDTEVESNTTISTLNIDQILQILDDASVECFESKDFVTFSTVLDVHLSNLSIYSEDERVDLLNKLIEIFTLNNELLYEVGWDLPPILLSFLDCECKPVTSLSDQKTTVLMLKVIELLTMFGNPKELLLTCCDLIGNLRQGESFSQEFIDSLPENLQMFYLEQPIRIYILKFHSLLELIISSLRKNKTIVPSKFLSMVVTKLIKLLNLDPSHSRQFPITRRLYTFIRDYTPPNLPTDNKDDNPEDLLKVVEAENYLQRQLLILFFSVVVEHASSGLPTQLLGNVFPSLVTDSGKSRYKEEFEIMSRFIALGMSMDLDYDTLFNEEVEKSVELFDNYTKILKNSEDLFELVISSYNKQVSNSNQSISNSISINSISFLFTYGLFIEHEKFKISRFKFMDLIKLQLNTLIPYLIQPKLINQTTIVSLMILTLKSLEDPSLTEVNKNDLTDISSYNKLLILSYLQYLTTLCLNINSPYLNTFFYTLLIKILISIDESIAYEFLIDSLINSPDLNGLKMNLIGMLKDLLKMTKPVALPTPELSSLKLNPEPDVSTKQQNPQQRPPPLPSRSLVKYITLTPDRSNELLSLFARSINDTFDVHEKTVQLDELNSVLSYLNLINTIDSFPADKITLLIDELERLVEHFYLTKGKKANNEENDDGEAGEDNEQLIRYLEIVSFNIEKTKKFYQL